MDVDGTGPGIYATPLTRPVAMPPPCEPAPYRAFCVGVQMCTRWEPLTVSMSVRRQGGGKAQRRCGHPSGLQSRVLLGASIAAVVLCSCNPAIARAKGVVTSVRKSSRDQITEVCLRDTTDAGSTYGDKRDRDSICWDGFVEGIEPTIGACVVLQSQGESSVLRVESAEGCK